MKIDFNIYKACHPKQSLNFIRSNHSRKIRTINIINEIKPVDLFCFLGAKFGPPNGPQNFLRRDDSDNLIHWDWLLFSETDALHIMGMNYRTEVWRISSEPVNEFTVEDFVSPVKTLLPSLGQKLTEVRKMLEKWDHIINPYVRLKTSINRLSEEVYALLDKTQSRPIPNLAKINESAQYSEEWNELAKMNSKAVGLAFGIRSMLPVLGESFVNLLYFILAKPEIKADKRLFSDVLKRQIDIRIKSLQIFCGGFRAPIDYSNVACGNFHTLMNNRNDLLHGNIQPEKLKFEEVYFLGKVPIFSCYEDMWRKSIGVEIESSGLDLVKPEIAVVEAFIEYLKSCLEPEILKSITPFFERREFGIRQDNGGLGILLPSVPPDFFSHPTSSESHQKSSSSYENDFQI